MLWTTQSVIALGVFVVAVLYASVGHGGASGYLAILSLLNTPAAIASSTALTLNLIVSGVSGLVYWRASHFNATLVLPFLATSIPLAYIGASMNISPTTYSTILSATLFLAALRLLTSSQPHPIGLRVPNTILLKATIGGIIGFVSGMIGVGGGIFLSPLLLFFGWADVKQTAAVSAVFIFLNSLSGIAGRVVSGSYVFDSYAVVLVAGVIGSIIGARFGALRATNTMLQKLLGIVLLIAAAKLILPIIHGML